MLIRKQNAILKETDEFLHFSNASKQVQSFHGVTITLEQVSFLDNPWNYLKKILLLFLFSLRNHFFA